MPLSLVAGTWHIFLDLLLENPGLLRDNEEFSWLYWQGVILLYLFLLLAGGSQGILHGIGMGLAFCEVCCLKAACCGGGMQTTQIHGLVPELLGLEGRPGAVLWCQQQGGGGFVI